MMNSEFSAILGFLESDAFSWISFGAVQLACVRLFGLEAEEFKQEI